MKLIRVGKAWAAVDDEDFDNLAEHKWYKNNKGYAYTFIKDENGKRQGMLMHRMIMHPDKGLDVHHKNHHPLDNTKNNLVICTHKENLQTLQKPKRKKSAATASQYKGVYRYEYKNRRSGKTKTVKFKVTIRSGGEQFHLGYFKDEIDAAKRYDKEARKRHGEFAVLNFP